MSIRKFTNGRFSLKRFTAPGVGGGSGAVNGGRGGSGIVILRWV